jgi:hypothetical protein
MLMSRLDTKLNWLPKKLKLKLLTKREMLSLSRRKQMQKLPEQSKEN